MMQGTLLLAILSIRSSYSRNFEEPAPPGEPPDTLQWWIGNDSAWRIRTFALDHDIHTYAVGISPEILEIASANNVKHYGAVTQSQHLLEFVNCTDVAEVELVFADVGLAPDLEVAGDRFAFWKPDKARYRTQSVPRESVDPE